MFRSSKFSWGRYKPRLYIFLALVLGVIHLFYSLGNPGVCVFNEGIAFGFGLGGNLFSILFSLFTLLLLVWGGLRYGFVSGASKYILIAVSIAAGFNLLDRLAYGGVCDYFLFTLPVKIFGISTIYFNINDIMIVVSLLIVFLTEFIGEKSNGED